MFESGAFSVVRFGFGLLEVFWEGRKKGGREGSKKEGGREGG